MGTHSRCCSLLAISLLLLVNAVSAPSAYCGPQNGTIVVGDGVITDASGTTTINQNTDRLAIEWDSFAIANGETVQFNQPSGSALALNIDFSGVASEIFGTLNANGQVLLLNQAGILIGESASINVGAFLASDMSIDIDDFSEGDFTLKDGDPTQGGITNLGSISSVQPSGVYILGQFISNQGDIISSNGDIHLAVGNEVIVASDASGMLGVQITDAIINDISAEGNLILNNGNIIASGGDIYIDVNYLRTLKLNTVNNQGTTNAIAIAENGGRIFLTDTPTPLSESEISDLEEIVSTAVAQPEEATASTSSSSDIESVDAKPSASIDAIVPTCIEGDIGSDTCNKAAALKRYLGRLLLGGDLPE